MVFAGAGSGTCSCRNMLLQMVVSPVAPTPRHREIRYFSDFTAANALATCSLKLRSSCTMTTRPLRSMT